MKFNVITISFLAIAIGYLGYTRWSKKQLETNKISYNFQIRPILSDKCFACHGPDPSKRAANLRLDLQDSAYAPLKNTIGSFAIVPGNPDASELYKRICSSDPDYQMPSPEAHLGALTKAETELFRKWIEQGAKYEKHWAFTPPVKADLPKISQKSWAKNEIDYFVLSKMEAMGLNPNDAADKERLLKRMCFDLIGLPPTLTQIEKFRSNQSEHAVEDMIDELMAMPQYGEKMALHWLDVARYADSYGYQDDNIRSQWPWRDWVIYAFNQNMPYDQFLTLQLAGDLIPNATKADILPTGFLRNHKYTEEGGVIDEEYRIQYVADKTKTYTKGILGMTMECAQCHDHKYDPLKQKDYYALFAFFNNSKEVGFEGAVEVSQPAKNPKMTITDADAQSILKFLNKKDTGNIMVSVMGERDTLRKTYILNRGLYSAPTTEVQPAAIPAVMAFDNNHFERNRLGLAKWTVDKRNPLTARVFVNQIWQEIFGRGIVKTSGDFGMQGELPTHPALLDWLSVDFMEHQWDIKYLIKKIMLSATYQQTAKVTKAQLAIDPDNSYLSHGPRNRLNAELIRDMVLSSSGLLHPELGGPSVKPYQPKGLWEAASSGRGVLATYKKDEGKDLYRRGMYTFIKLTVPPPSMGIFDASNRDQCEVKRTKTNTPLQALVMLNDPTVLEASRVLAQKLLAESKDIPKQIEKAFQLIICRKPTNNEKNILTKYFDDQLVMFTKDKAKATKMLEIGAYPLDKQVETIPSAAMMKVVNTIYNMEEAITKS